MKNSIKILVFSMLAVIMFYGDINATHVIGGNITYRHVSGDTYEVDLTFRRDCFTGAPDAVFENQAKIYILDDDGNLLQTYGSNNGIPIAGGIIYMNLNPNDTLTTTIRSDCGFEGTQVCVQETIYRTTVRLPHRPGQGAYNLVYQRCCRNPTLANINEAVQTGGTWITRLTEETLMSHNSSPEFNQWPDVYICADQDIAFDHSAIDPDGDSLVYKLYTPLAGLTNDTPIALSPPIPPYEEVSWSSPYNIDNLLGGSPLSIDPETGFITGIPNLVGQFLVGVVVEEYRDGELIGFTRRDFQYNVRICTGPPTADFIPNEGECRGTTVEFENITTSAINYMWNFNYPSTDSEFMSTEENPTFTYDEPGIYQVQLIATRGTDSCRSEIIKSVPAVFADIDVDFDLLIEECLDGGSYTIELTDRTEDNQPGETITGQEWTITQGGVETVLTGSPVQIDIEPGTFDVDLKALSSSGCASSAIKSYNTDEFVQVADFSVSPVECPSNNEVELEFTDLSPGLNPFDEAETIVWTVTSSSGVEVLQGSVINVTVSKFDEITVLQEIDFGGGCTASIEKTFLIDDLIPKASYDYGAVECVDEENVTLFFNNTSTETNPLYTSAGVMWTIINQDNGEVFISDENSINYMIGKDIAIDLMMIVNFENGCVDTLQETFVPGPYPTLVFTADPRKVCLGDTIPLLANPNSEWTYTWSPLEGLFFTDAEDLSTAHVIGINNTSYNVTVTDGICSVTDDISVEVLDGENLTVTGDEIICDDQVSLVASGGIPPGQFEWSLTSTFDEIISTGADFNTTLEGNIQTFYVRYTGETCGDEFIAYTVEKRIFDLDFGGNPVQVCDGDTLDLLLNPNPLFTYTWSPETDLIFPDGDTSNPQFIGNEDMTYTVAVTDGKCNDEIMVTVDVLDAVDVEIEGDEFVCVGDQVVLSVPELQGDFYEWSDANDFSNIIGTDRELTVDLTGDSTTYYVRYTGDLCGEPTDSITVLRYYFDLLYIDPILVCAGDTLVYEVFNEGIGDLTYVWDADEHILEGGNTSSPTIGIGSDEATLFTLTFTATTETGCVYTDEIEFDFSERPVVDFDATLTECGEYMVCFNINGEYNGFPSWEFGDPTTDTDRSIDAMPCYTYPGPGVYEVILNNISSVCAFDEVVKTITINDEILINDIEDQQACLGEIINITASSPSTNVKYTWFNLEGDTLVSGSTFSGIVDTFSQIIVEVKDPFGCTAYDTIGVSPYLYDIEDNIPEVFCIGQDFQVELTINGVTEGFSYEWSPLDCVVSGGDTANPILNTTQDKTFRVVITDNETGCEVTKTYTVEATTYDINVVADPDAMINRGESVIIYVEDPQSDYEYEWSTGETSDEIEVAPEEDAFYTVTVVNEFDCIAIDTINITVRQPRCDETDIFVPNAFTPNGDDMNSVFLVRSNFIEELEMVVFNRWGEEIFRSNDQNVGWDGTFNGELLQPDAFAYYITARCINGVTYVKRGDISILK